MVSFLTLALTGIVFMGLNTSTAQAFPGFLEGPITDVDVAGRTMTVNGVTADVPLGTPIASPTNSNLTLGDISKGTFDEATGEWSGALPGRPTGFEGGTCLCTTEVDELTGAVTITDVMAEPAENVLIATVTAHNCTTTDCSAEGDVLEVGGTPVARNTDDRLLSPSATNGGFDINLMGSDLDPANNPTKVPAAVEGYMGEDGAIYFYVLEIEGGNLMNPLAEISVTRARCRNKNGGGQWRVEGNVRNPGTGGVAGDVTGTVTLTVAGGTLTAQATADPIDPSIGIWSVRQDTAFSCTETGSAQFVANDTTTTAPTAFGVDVR